MADRLLKLALAEISDIRICHECYLNKKENCSYSCFTMACNEPHLLVWVKRAACEPYWPAKLMKINDNDSDMVTVRFFSDGISKDDNGDYHRLVTIASNDCFLYTENCPYTGSNNCCTMHPLMQAERVSNSNLFRCKTSKFYRLKLSFPFG